MRSEGSAQGPGNTGHRAPDRLETGAGFADYLRVLWARRWWVGATAAVFGTLALVVSSLMPAKYEASVTVIVTESKLGEGREGRQQVPPATFVAMVENLSQAERVIKDFGLDKPPHRFNPRRFVDHALKVEVVRNTNLLRVRVRLGDPEIATRVANQIVRYGVALNEQINQEESVLARDFLGRQFEEAQKRKDDLAARLVAYQKQVQLELLRKDAEALLTERSKLLPLHVDIESERALLAKAEEEIEKRKKIETVKRSIENEPALTEVMRQRQQAGGDLLHYELRNDLINPVWEALDMQIAASRTRLAALEQRRQELARTFRLDSDRLRQLDDLYAKEAELAGLELAYRLASKTYTDLDWRYQQARILVASRSTALQIVDAAIPPDRPVSPDIPFNVGVALAVGLCFSSTVVIVWERLYGGRITSGEPSAH